MQRRLKQIILPALLTLIFIVITVIVSQSSLSLSYFGRFCFMFNEVPFIIGFNGGNDLLLWSYYFLLWLVLTAIGWALLNIKRMLYRPPLK